MNETKIIQQYVANNLVEKQIITTEDLIHDILEVCSEEQINTILIKHLKNVVKNDENSKDNENDNENEEEVYISLTRDSNINTLLITKVIKDNLETTLKEAKDFVDDSFKHRAIFKVPVLKRVAKKIKSEIEPLGGTVDIK